MKLLRTLPTGRLLALIGITVAAAVAAGAVAVTALGSAAASPPPKPLAQAVRDALTAPEPQGVTAHVVFTNRLFPSGALLGQTGSPLMSGATGRMWVTPNGLGRIELQSDAGDVQIVWSPSKLTVYDASSNTAYVAALPARAGTSSPEKTRPATLASVSTLLTKLGERLTLSGATPTTVAKQGAYTVAASPKQNAGLFGPTALAWDAVNGVPLRVAISAKGSATPVLELRATNVSFGAVPQSTVDVSPPAGAKIVDLGSPTAGSGSEPKGTTRVTGLANVQAAVGFPIVAPDTLAGRARRTVTLVRRGTSHGALLVYGQGLDSILVLERRADAAQTSPGGPLAALPKVSSGGLTGNELATQLGTAIVFRNNGVSFVIVGSVPASTAQAALGALG